MLWGMAAQQTPTGGKNGETPMADEASAGQPVETQSEAAAPTNGHAAGQQAGAEEKRFTQADMDRVVKERLERAKADGDKAAQKAREEAERKASEEQGKFKELYDAAQARLAAVEQEAKELRLNQERRAVADRVGLPAALAERLHGETLEEMESDARTLLAALPKPAAPNINNGGSAPATAAGMDEAMRREYAARLGVKPQFFKPTKIG